VLLFTEKKTTVQTLAERLQIPRSEDFQNDASAEAVVASELQWYGFQLAFSLKIWLHWAWERLPVIFMAQERRSPAFPLTLITRHHVKRGRK